MNSRQPSRHPGTHPETDTQVHKFSHKVLTGGKDLRRIFVYFQFNFFISFKRGKVEMFAGNFSEFSERFRFRFKSKYKQEEFVEFQKPKESLFL